MKISLLWLNDYVDVSDFLQKPEDLANKLIAVGLEVESITNQAKNFQHVVVGHVVELGRHPNADKLTLCQVDVGDGKTRQIVCGAKNHKQGDKVVAALPGAVLPGEFSIKISKIRDVESQGMLCSETELGLKTESEGIVILPKDVKVGTPFAEYAGLNDVIFEINVTPNRADCLSHIGLAREISCLLDRTLKAPAAKIKAGSKKTKEHIDVKLVDFEQCPRYCGRSVFGVKVAPSPDWLKNRLQAVGLNTINNIVDVTNFVMMEYGQPLHAFDARELQSEKIIIEKAKAGEKFKTFDGTELTLKGDELTIRDGARAVALAGVIGGLNSGVTDKTTEIFLEAANFNPKGVRRSSRRHGVDTDSAYRFSRGTDIENVEVAMNRAIALIVELAGGEAAKESVDLYPTPLKRKPIKVRHSTLEDRLGYKVSLADFSKWMKRLHCEVKPGASKGSGKSANGSSEDVVTVEAPSFRVDIEIEMDLVEEYARLTGYDKIPETFPVLAERPTNNATGFDNENRLAELLKNEGFFEARNYSFLNGKWQTSLFDSSKFNKLGVGVAGAPVVVKNPLSEETGTMRQSLLPGLISNLFHNFHRGNLNGRLFEIGHVFGKNESYNQGHRLAVIQWGHKENLWSKPKEPVVYDVKSTFEGIVRRLKGQLQWRKCEAEMIPNFIHPGQVASLFYEGKNIGFIGALHPAFREEHKVRVDVAVGELDLEPLMRGQPRLPKISKLSKFPSVERDFALVLPLTLPVGDVVKEIEKAAAPLVQSVEVFDVFRGQGIPEGQQSVAFRLTLQDLEATLSEERLLATTQQVLVALEKKFAIKAR